MFLFPDREPKFPDGALFIPIKSDRISLVKRKDKANRFASERLRNVYRKEKCFGRT